MDWFEGMMRAIPPPFGYLLTALFPFIAVGGFAGALVSAWKHQKGRTAILAAVALVAFGATAMWASIAAQW